VSGEFKRIPIRQPNAAMGTALADRVRVGRAVDAITLGPAEARPQVVLEAKRLRRASPLNGKRRSFRKISKELAAMGHLTSRGTPFSASAVQAMVEGPMPPK
jgi:hypothetical protein